MSEADAEDKARERLRNLTALGLYGYVCERCEAVNLTESAQRMAVVGWLVGVRRGLAIAADMVRHFDAEEARALIKKLGDDLDAETADLTEYYRKESAKLRAKRGA